MKIQEFAWTYCRDFMEAAEKRAEMLDLSGFSYDEILWEEDGTEVKVINTVNYQIPITDILGMNRQAFCHVWPYEECMEAYDAYVENLILIEGKAVLTMLRNRLRQEQEKIEAYDEIPEAFR